MFHLLAELPAYHAVAEFSAIVSGLNDGTEFLAKHGVTGLVLIHFVRHTFQRFHKGSKP